MFLVSFIFFLPPSFAPASSAQIPEDRVDRATREVDRPIRREIEQEIWITTPKKAPIIKEGDAVAGDEGGEAKEAAKKESSDGE